MQLLQKWGVTKGLFCIQSSRIFPQKEADIISSLDVFHILDYLDYSLSPLNAQWRNSQEPLVDLRISFLMWLHTFVIKSKWARYNVWNDKTLYLPALRRHNVQDPFGSNSGSLVLVATSTLPSKSTPTFQHPPSSSLGHPCLRSCKCLLHLWAPWDSQGGLEEYQGRQRFHPLQATLFKGVASLSSNTFCLSQRQLWSQ